MSEHTIQDIGYRSESTFDTSLITASVKPIAFGLAYNSWGKFPQFSHEIIQRWLGTGRDPAVTRVAKEMTMGQLTIVPTDSLQWQHSLGKVVNDGLGKHTITGLDDSPLPSYSIRAESSNGIQAIRKEVTGVRNKSHSFVFDMREPDNIYSENINYLGRRYITPAVDSRIEPIHADGNTLAQQNEYIRDSNFDLRWDVDGDNVDVGDDFLDFTYLLDNAMRQRWIKGLTYPKIISTGKRTHALGFNFRRGSELSIYDDFISQLGTDMFSKMSFNIYNSPTTYKKFIWTNVSIKSPGMNHALLNRGEQPSFDVEAFAESCTVETVDGVADALYTAV